MGHVRYGPCISLLAAGIIKPRSQPEFGNGRLSETPFRLRARTLAKRSFADRRSQTEFGNEGGGSLIHELGRIARFPLLKYQLIILHGIPNLPLDFACPV